MLQNAKYLVQHQIDSDLSFGVFDTEYVYKREESKATQGKLYWNVEDESAGEERLLEEMDFPLVSIAMSYDQFNPLDMQRLAPLIETLPAFGLIYGILGARDPRTPESWHATGPRQNLMRNATATRTDHAGYGLMGKLARWLMKEAKVRGFKGIQIECVHDAVTKVWLHPPEGMKGELVCSFDTETYVDEEGGRPFGEAKQLITKIFVTL